MLAELLIWKNQIQKAVVIESSSGGGKDGARASRSELANFYFYRRIKIKFFQGIDMNMA